MSDWGDIFGKVLIPEPAERMRMLILADELRKPGETDPGRHLGEAETLAIIEARSLNAVFLTDDLPAANESDGHSRLRHDEDHRVR